jgi:glycosyltransferase involved in cell wall biosynthesis
MKILAHIHAFFPHHCAGAEAMVLAMLRDLRTRGHEVAVWVREEAYKFPDDFDGIEIVNANTHPCEPEEWHKWADVIMTHLDCSGEVNNETWRLSFQHKVVWICHNSHKYIDFERRPGYYRVIYNSEWLKEKMQYPQASIVVRPPVNHLEYEVESTREYITLINCNKEKGGRMLIDLARRMPDRKFLGILGSYGVQEKALLPNLTYLHNNPNIKETYAKTNILLMPSSYESWGRVAIEAYSSGIPVIAHPTAGLVESMGRGGLFAMRESVDAWEAQIVALDKQEAYQKASEYGKTRAIELDPTEDFNELEKFLCLSKSDCYALYDTQAKALQLVSA